MKVVYLHMTSWVGTCAIGAQHTYGTLKWRKAGTRYEWEEHDLRRKMTAREIRTENEESHMEGCGPLFKRGATTRGFASEKEVIAAALKESKALFPEDDCLIVQGDGCSVSAQPVIRWPQRYASEAKRLNELAEEWDKIGGYGYRGSAANKARDKRAEEIDEEWLKLIRTIAPEI